MTGTEALRQIESAVQREIVLDVKLVARALCVSRGQILRDWASRGLPKIRIGHTTVLPIDEVCRAYFSHLTCDPITSGISVTLRTSDTNPPVPTVILGPARTVRHTRSSAHV